MPNWCSNSVTLSHDNPEMIARAVKGYLASSLINEFLPCPQELIDTIAGSYGDEDKQRELELKQKANFEKYGAKDWYDWSIANWGTKWDVGGDEYTQANPNTCRFSFESAWAPPIQFFEHLESLGFQVEAMYYEPGMCFCGIYSDGFDEYYEYSDMDSTDVATHIPSQLDEEFSISESMAEWENDQESDLELDND
jgi:hypothetical protein